MSAEPDPRRGSEELSAETLSHIARIARLRLTNDEVERLRREAGSILAYFDDIKDAASVETATDPPSEVEMLRDDRVEPPDAGAVAEMVGAFKKRAGRRLLVPRGL